MFYLPTSGPITRCLIAGAVFSLLFACAEQPTPKPAAPAPSGMPTPSAPSRAPQPTLSFSAWREAFRGEALAAGISAATFDSAFAGITPDPAVVSADSSQPEFTRPVWAYLDSAISAQRVRNGQALLGRHAATLERIEQRYGVDRQALVAVWGMESSFGQYLGDKSVIRSLATLAYEGRRPAFAHSELLAALSILQDGDVPPARLLGSWAGAMGQTQFIPSTYNRYAVDFDGDGRRDIWSSSADALASTAHYLQASGWRQGQPWGFEVRLPAGFDYAQADADIRRPLSEWRRLGVANIPPASTDEPAALLLPAGHRGPAFVVLANFRAILKYNNSSSYALAAGLLAERFQERGRVLAAWPRDDQPLSRSERIELQERLAARGFDPGAADSIIGANTRKAIRGFQQTQGWPADGYPTQELLQKLRDL
ncbi:MAG: lytic murein transglycosylase [Pseudomonas sp.]